jgi:iron complex outermembrane receptor protein
MLKKNPLAISTLLLPLTTYAGPLPEVTVEAQPWRTQQYSADTNNITHADSAEVLKAIPGASVNRNGGLTGIAQYRGFYGDRVSVIIDSASLVSAGPNAMDSPLSYIPASQLKSISIDKGATSVSKAQESLGGLIDARSNQGEFSHAHSVVTFGEINTQFNSQNSASNTSVLLGAANSSHKLFSSSSYDEADDSQFDGGNIDSTSYQRQRYNITYGYQNNETNLNIRAGKNNTDGSGTPALPMDITAIDTDLAGFDLSTKIKNATLSWASDYSHAYHTMDNFSLRPTPANSRENIATGQKINHKLMLAIPLSDSELRIGADQSNAQHTATIYNPDMSAFEIENFKGAERNITGAYAEWTLQASTWDLELGARINRVAMDSNDVSAFMGAGMMTNMATVLATNFNNSDASETYNNRDLVLKYSNRLSKDVSLSLSLSSKERAPSYQERYLWLPLQSTGGLADGYTYIGNLDLESETSNEVNVSIDYNFANAYLSLNVFYRDVDNFIQGTPYVNTGVATIDTAVAAFANMMSGGNPALQYNNVDAKLYGGEINYGTQLSDTIAVNGSLSYVRGKRTDVSDDLYRLSPLNHLLSLDYNKNDLILSLISEITAAQNNVSEFNSEQKTSGYSLFHIKAHFTVSDQLTLRAGINNLTNKRYQDHLSGYNRVSGNEDINQGERLFGTGRSLSIGASYSF